LKKLEVATLRKEARPSLGLDGVKKVEKKSHTLEKGEKAYRGRFRQGKRKGAFVQEEEKPDLDELTLVLRKRRKIFYKEIRGESAHDYGRTIRNAKAVRRRRVCVFTFPARGGQAVSLAREKSSWCVGEISVEGRGTRVKNLYPGRYVNRKAAATSTGGEKKKKGRRSSQRQGKLLSPLRGKSSALLQRVKPPKRPDPGGGRKSQARRGGEKKVGTYGKSPRQKGLRAQCILCSGGDAESRGHLQSEKRGKDG